MSPTSPPDHRDELARLIQAVQAAVPVVQAAALRIERMRQEPVNTAQHPGDLENLEGQAIVDKANVDQAIVDRWLSDLGRIAAMTCDQPNPVSKELGARLEELGVGLSVHLDRP